MRARSSLTDSATTDALDSLRRIIRALRVSSRRAERELGVSGAQLFVLQRLAEGPAGSVNELAERTHTHQSSVSVVVRRLVERGLVSRRRSPTDQRRVELALSAAGRRVLQGSRPAAHVRLADAMRRLPRDRRTRLAALLRELVALMGAADESASMMFDDDENRSTPG